MKIALPSRYEIRGIAPAVLADAVLAVLRAPRDQSAVIGTRPSGRLPSLDDTPHARGDDLLRARRLSALLTLSYIVASADGVTDAERDALALLLETAAGISVDRAALLAQFAAADKATLGIDEKLAQPAAAFVEYTDREEALGLAALVAMADGIVDPAETMALLKLGEYFAMADHEVDAIIKLMFAKLEAALDLPSR